MHDQDLGSNLGAAISLLRAFGSEKPGFTCPGLCTPEPQAGPCLAEGPTGPMPTPLLLPHQSALSSPPSPPLKHFAFCLIPSRSRKVTKASLTNLFLLKCGWPVRAQGTTCAWEFIFSQGSAKHSMP